MINKNKVIAWIPARGGSKGIIDKNIIDLCGKNLISYTIDAAKNSKYIDKIMVSTDSERIARIAQNSGAWVPSLRPVHLASDYSKTIDAVIYSIELMKDMNENYDIFCLLQPTSPLRDEKDIDGAIESFIKNGEKGLVAVSLCEINPILIRKKDDNGILTKILPEISTIRRQDMPEYYRVNGSIYINKVKDISNDTSFNDNPIPYIIDASHGVDIDDNIDLVIAEYILNNKNT